MNESSRHIHFHLESHKVKEWKRVLSFAESSLLVNPPSSSSYDLFSVQLLQQQCSHVPPDDWNTPGCYNPILVQIQVAWYNFLKASGIEQRTVKNGALLYLVPQCLPWYALKPTSSKVVALIIHFLTTQEAHSLKNHPGHHTSNLFQQKQDLDI